MHNLSPATAPVVVEYRTWLERFLFPASLIALLGFLLALVNYLWVTGYLHEFSAPGMAISFFALVFLVSMFFGFSSSYEFDANQRVVWFRIRFFSLTKAVKVANFTELCGFSVTGIRNRARIHTWWSYQVLMLCRSGRKIPVSNARDQSIHTVNRLAERLAEICGLYYQPGQADKVLHLQVAGEQPVIEFHDWTAADYFREFAADIMITLLFFAAVLAFIVGLAVSLN